MAEMTALEYFKEKNRMTKKCSIDCTDFPLSSENNITGFACSGLQKKYPEIAISIVEKWSKEHPRKTILQDFLEKYPKAELIHNKFPEICPYSLGYAENSQCVLDDEERFCSEECEECWNRPMEEK